MKRGHQKKNKSPKYLPDFLHIPYQIFTDEELSSTDKFVYGAIYFFYNTTAGKKCTANNETLGDLIKTTATTVSNSLVILERRRYIKRIFHDSSNKNRKEIIPLVVVVKLSKNKSPISPKSVPSESGIVQPESETNIVPPESGSIPSESGSIPSESGTTFTNNENKKTSLRLTGKQINSISDENWVPPQSGERERREKKKEIKSKLDLLDHPAGDGPNIPEPMGNFTDQKMVLMKFKNIEEIPEQNVSDGIALFLPVFPDQFVSKNPFAVPANRLAVKRILMRLTLLELKDIIDKYVSKKGDQYRPEAATIATFCNFKMDRIEAFVKKSFGNLWAQRSISTPEQRAASDNQIAEMLRISREKQRKDKEQWEKEHPSQ